MGKAHVLILFSCHLAHVYFVCLHVHIDLTNAAFFFLSSGSTRLWCSLGGTERVSYRSPLDNPGCFGCILLFFFLAGLGGSAHIETSAAPFRRERENNRRACNMPLASEPPKPISTPPHISARKAPHCLESSKPFRHSHPISIDSAGPPPPYGSRALLCPIGARGRGWLAGWLADWRSIRGV
jgi:hypothetical protein